MWYVDSGASKHITGNKKLFSSLSKIDHGEVMIGDASTHKIEAIGEICFKTKFGNIEKMSEVYFVPGFQSNLFRAGHLTKKGYDLHMSYNACTISKGNQVIAKIGVTSNNLFPLKFETKIYLVLLLLIKKFQSCGMIGLDT